MNTITWLILTSWCFFISSENFTHVEISQMIARDEKVKPKVLTPKLAVMACGSLKLMSKLGCDGVYG
jgi:hypothetical protein